ncbi:ArnT family glycosyltransferase [Hymenobacter sp. 5414T-23]|uniref:ArnT family glycosyltransferase n=1 Tax=Hymenobacter sp. 5414T-23 TaxID=2932252 RepID=UPI001FD52505|nr:glycosyltransferase family 39 protein [Hymenobacter sp. 5414T-23]UOQ82124.1 glycosyltransferase family 39 protein [Hymenobacter sp. 5414T-23]
MISRRLADWTLLFVVLFTIAYFFLSHEGLYAIDDYFYSRYAHQLISGTFRVAPDPQGLLHDPLKERPMIYGPVALCYLLFGINIISSTLWPLLATLGCAVLFWKLYRRREPVVAATAMLLLGLHYFTLNLTNYLYPDNILMFWCLAGSAALLVGRRAEARKVAWGMGFAGLSFAALLSKETIVYYLPFYLAVLGRDAWRRQNLRFWVAAMASGLVLLSAYLAFYQLFTNDALYRLHLIEHTNEFLKEGNYLLGNRAALMGRITWQPLAFFIGTGLGPLLLLAIAALLQPAAPDSDKRFWLGLGFSTLLFFWVGSTSLSQYNPITLLPRMTTPLLPPLALAAGYGLRTLLRTGKGVALVALDLLLCAGGCTMVFRCYMVV